MVKDHYKRLGFDQIEQSEDGASRSILRLDGFQPQSTFIEIVRG